MTALVDQPDKSPALVKRFWNYASLLLAVAVIAIILRSISLAELGDALHMMNIGYLLLAYGLNVIMVTLLAFRWWILYGIDAERPAYRYLLKVSFVGVFFNNLLPGSFGGDIYRTLHMSQRGEGKIGLSHSLAVILFDRLTGLFGMVLIGATAVLLNNMVDLPGHVGLWMFVFLAGFGLVLYLSVNRRVYDLVIRLFGWLPERYLRFIETRVNHLYERVAVFAHRRELVFFALVVSIIQRIVWFTGCYLVSQALHLDISLLLILIVLPIIEVIRTLPLTMQGIGIREGLYVLFFGSASVTNAEATLLSVLIYALLSLNGLIGGAIYLWDQRRALTVLPGRKSATPPQ